MRIVSKLFQRTPVYSILLVCLLSVGVAFSSISIAFFASARAQQAEINGSYTTTAIPYCEGFPGYMPMPLDRNGFSLTALTMEELLEDAPLDYRLDRRVLLGAVVEGTTSLTPAVNMVYYSPEMDSPYAASVFAVKCTGVKTSEAETYQETYDPDGTLINSETITGYLYDYQFSVIRALAFMDRGDEFQIYMDEETGSIRQAGFPPEELEVSTKIGNMDGTPIFEVGKTYLLRGDCPLNQSGTATSAFYLENGAVNQGAEEHTQDGVSCLVISENVLPLYVEYTGDLDDFLSSAEGVLWRDTIIPAVKKNYSSARLILSDNVSSIYWFNTGTASILQGRLFTEEEYKSGERVCLVSADYAERNGLSLGDTVAMELYRPTVGARRHAGFDESLGFVPDDKEAGTCIMLDPCMPNNSLELRQTYTIVGIYTAPSFTYGAYAFGPDTIFAPKASVPGAEAYEADGAYIPLLNSAMISNGASEKLNAFLEAKGLGGSFLYFDQGYTEASEAVSTLMGNARRLLAAGSTFLAITAGLYLFLCVHKMKTTIASLRRMGVSRKTCWREIQTAVAPMILASVLAGVTLSALLFEKVSRLLGEQMELPLGALIWSGVGTLAGLLFLAGLCTWRATGVGLMQKRKRGGKRT